MLLKLTSTTSTFMLKDVGVLIEATPGSTFEDSRLMLDLSQSKSLQAKILSGDVIVSDGTNVFIPSAGLQYLASIWSQGGLSTVVRMASALSTGLLFGGLLSVNVLDNTKFDLSAGGGIVVDNYSDPANPTLKYIEWPDRIGVVDPYIATDTETYIYIDEHGDFTFSGTRPTCVERRTAIHIGWTSHPDYLTLEDAYTEPVVAVDAINQMADFFAALGPFNVFGNEYSAQANLKIQRNAGALWDEGANYKNNPKQPHVFHLSAESPITDIWYFHRDPADPSGWNNNLPSVGDIDPSKYDDGSGTLAAVPAGKFTVQLITLYAPWNVTDIQYGQKYYDTLDAAVDHIPVDCPVLNPWNSEWDVLRGWLVIQEGTIDITDPLKTRFLVATRFGSVMGIGGGGSGGEVNTASNQGLAGIGMFLSKVGVDLQFKNLRAASTKLTVANNAGQRTVDVDLGPHKDTHEGGSDAISPSGIGAEPAFSKNTAFNKNFGAALGDVCQGNDARLSDARTPTAHKDSHKSEGTDALLSTDLIEAIVKRIQESTGPTNLLVGAIADGQYLQRVGTGIVGTAAPGGISAQQATATEATSTTSTTDVLIADMTVTPGAGTYLAWFSGTTSHSSGNTDGYVSLYAAGAQVAHSARRFRRGNSDVFYPVETHMLVTVAAGQAIEARWRTAAGTITCENRSLLLLRIA